MTDTRPQDLIGHIRQAAFDATMFVSGMDRTQFETDKKSQQAVIYSLLIVGEAATKVMDRYPEFESANSHIPWRGMRGMRNRLAHDYFDINLDVVWGTVQNVVPEMLLQIEKHILGPLVDLIFIRTERYAMSMHNRAMQQALDPATQPGYARTCVSLQCS